MELLKSRLIKIFFIFICLFFLEVGGLLAQTAPTSSTLVGIIKQRLNKWNTIYYRMSIYVEGVEYEQRVYFKHPDKLKIINFNKQNSSDKIITLVNGAETRLVKPDGKEDIYDTGNFDIMRVNLETDPENPLTFKVKYLGEYKMTFPPKGKQTRKSWVALFTTPQGLIYKFWFDQKTGIVLMYRIYNSKDAPPFFEAVTNELKVDKPLDVRFDNP